MRSLHNRTAAALAGLIATILALSACSSSNGAGTVHSGSASSSNAASSGGTATGSAGVSEYAALLAKAYAGVPASPPTEPAKARTGLNVWYLSCGQQAPICANGASDFTKAAAILNWKVRTCDGQLNPTGWGNCVRQAIAAKADALVVAGPGCSSIQQPLIEAKNAGLVTISAGGLDCDANGGQKRFSASLRFDNGNAFSQYQRVGELQADYVIGKTNGKAKVLLLNFTDEAWGPILTRDVSDTIAKCSGCKVVSTLDIGNADVSGGTLVQKFSTALLQAPDVNAVIVPVDAWYGLGLARAIASTGRHLIAIGEAGDTTNLDLIRKGSGETATVATDAGQTTWAVIDTTIRALNGQPSISEGLGYQVVDHDHNLPANGPYVSSVDYQSAYKKLWGLPAS